MSLHKFPQQLVREIQRSPKKALLLSLLVAVASYFWAPLVWGWFSPGEQAAQQDAGPAEPPAPSNPTGNTLVKQEQTAVPKSWQELWALMKDDARRQPGDEFVMVRDPFVSKPPEPEKSTSKIVKTKSQEKVTPQDFGLKLGGTLIKGEHRVALINGKAYHVTENIDVGDDVGFVVAGIAAKRVSLLSRDGRIFVLGPTVPGGKSLRITQVKKE